jgi:hypothetical protein
LDTARFLGSLLRAKKSSSGKIDQKISIPSQNSRQQVRYYRGFVMTGSMRLAVMPVISTLGMPRIAISKNVLLCTAAKNPRLALPLFYPFVKLRGRYTVP